MPRLASQLLTGCLLLSCATGEQVARRRGDAIQTSRRIDPLAYAWYVRGSHHERAGDFSRAAKDYQAALEHDPKSGSAWAALGRVQCRMDPGKSRQIFERGLRHADRRAPIYVERGSCRLNQAGTREGLLDRACEDFSEAMKLEPHARSVSERFAACLYRTGKLDEARRQERAHRLYYGAPLRPPLEPTLLAVDRALLAGDLLGAQELSLELMSPGALAARAALLGQGALAREQAALVLRASPDDPDASITLVALGSALPPETRTLQSLSGPSLLLLFRTLKRTSGAKIASQFLEEYREQLLSEADPLVEEIMKAENSHGGEVAPEK